MIKPHRPPSRMEFEFVLWGSLAVGAGLIGCIIAMAWMVTA